MPYDLYHQIIVIYSRLGQNPGLASALPSSKTTVRCDKPGFHGTVPRAKAKAAPANYRGTENFDSALDPGSQRG